MSLVQKFFTCDVGRGSSVTIPLMCRKTDQVAAVIRPKVDSVSNKLGRYLTARGFSSLKAALIAIHQYMYDRYSQLNKRFDIGIAVYPLSEKRETVKETLLTSRIPQSHTVSFCLYDTLPHAQQSFREFHRSLEEIKLNTLQS
jgi:hypothetical protein